MHKRQAGPPFSLLHKLDSVLEDGFLALGAVLDIEGTYDNTPFESMCRAAAEHRLEHNAWVHAILSRRKILMAPIWAV
jgi:hypothetical protein